MKFIFQAIFLPLIILSIVATTLLIAGNVIRDNSLSAASFGNAIVVKWSTVDETGVQTFEVWRSSQPRTSPNSTLQFVRVKEMPAKGYSSSYEYTDNEAFKTSGGFYTYKIRIIYVQGPPSESQEVSVSGPTSAAKRTWGSIKAMFR